MVKLKQEKQHFQYCENLIILDSDNFQIDLIKKYENVFKIYTFE